MKLGFSAIFSLVLLCIKSLFPIFLVGCVASGVHMVDPLSEYTVVPPEQGYVVARVVNAGNVAYPINYLTIAPKNLNESTKIKSTRLQALTSIYGESTVFTSPVAAGEYSLNSIRAYHSSGERWYDRWIDGDVKLGTFEVRAGTVTDLGTIIYYPKVQDDRYIETLIRSPGEGNEQTVKSLFPFFKYEPGSTLGWKEDENDADRHSLYSSAVQNPVVYNQRYLAPDGSIYFIGKLGSIIKRTAQAEWEVDAVDTDSDLIAVVANSQGDLLVGGEQGTLFVKKKDSEWVKLDLEARYSVRDITFYGDNVVDVIVVDARNVKVLRGRLDQALSSWKTMASYKPYIGWLDQYGNLQDIKERKKSSGKKRLKLVRSASVSEVDGANYLFMTTEAGSEFSIFNSRKNHAYIYDPDTWILSKSKGFDGGIDNILNAGESKIAIKNAGFWVPWDTFFSWSESSDKWVKMSMRLDRCPHIKSNEVRRCMIGEKERSRFRKFSFLSVPIFTSPSTALAFVKFRQDNTGFMRTKLGKIERAVVQTTDGGLSWTETDIDIPSEYCTHAVPEVKGVLLVSCFGVSSDMYQSDDGGKTWDHVREHENI